MRAWLPIRGILDLAEEEVAIRSGLLLTDHDVFQLLAGTPLEGWIARLSGSPEEMIGIRPEFFEDITRSLRAAVGELPDAEPAIVRRIPILKELIRRGVSPTPIMEAFSAEWESGKYESIGNEACIAVAARTGASLDDVNLVFMIMADEQQRSAGVMSSRVKQSDWDGHIPLGDLFETESIPKDPGAFLDQRFIDFLAAQPEKLQEINWRNFERLTGEFFDRQDYEVQLGPGTKDGGVDLRVWPKGKRNGPPLILVQCKRYSANRLVAVENVKSLWADVTFEGAKKGLIATTSRVTPDGHRIASARKYPLSFAESEQVKGWVRSMWRHSWTGESSFRGVGQYQLPPFYPIRPGDLDFLEEPSRPAKRKTRKERKRQKAKDLEQSLRVEQAKRKKRN